MYPREMFLIFRRYAGHSKWQNIKHTKALKDHQRSMVFTKLCQKIKVAIQENGNNTDPRFNLHLAQAIENAKGKDMPLASIQSCIKSTQADKEGSKLYNYSIRGPRASILLVLALTNSQRRTKQEISYYLKKVGGIMSDQTFETMFDKKGTIVALPPKELDNIEETSVDHAIEAGAEEVTLPDEEKKLTFFCDMGQLHKVKNNLQELSYQIEECKISFVPKTRVSLNDNEMDLMSKIIGRLEEHPEVVDIYDNIE